MESIFSISTGTYQKALSFLGRETGENFHQVRWMGRAGGANTRGFAWSVTTNARSVGRCSIVTSGATTRKNRSPFSLVFCRACGRTMWCDVMRAANNGYVLFVPSPKWLSQVETQCVVNVRLRRLKCLKDTLIGFERVIFCQESKSINAW